MKPTGHIQEMMVRVILLVYMAVLTKYMITTFKVSPRNLMLCIKSPEHVLFLSLFFFFTEKFNYVYHLTLFCLGRRE